MKRYLLIGATAAALAVPALAFGGTTTTVTVEAGGFNSFGPATVAKTVGAGGIHWRWGTSGTTFADHNVRQDAKLFYSGPITNSNPAGFDVVPSAGTFHYYCEVHGSPGGSPSQGMNGFIKIKPAIVNVTAHSFGVVWSPGSNDSGNAFDVRYRVDGGQWKVWKNDTTAAKATFGLNDKPVRVRAGHTYDVQVRSENKSNPDKRSAWSPLARVTT